MLNIENGAYSFKEFTTLLESYRAKNKKLPNISLKNITVRNIPSYVSIRYSDKNTHFLFGYPTDWLEETNCIFKARPRYMFGIEFIVGFVELVAEKIRLYKIQRRALHG